MSRVRKPGNKYVNENKYNHSVTDTPKMQRSKAEKTDFTKAKTLSSWLFLKYDMSYKTYRNKSKARRAELREEYLSDTGNPTRPDVSFATYLAKYGKIEKDYQQLSESLQLAWKEEYEDWKEIVLAQYRKKKRYTQMTDGELEYEDGMMILAETGVPFGPDGTPFRDWRQLK